MINQPVSMADSELLQRVESLQQAQLLLAREVRWWRLCAILFGVSCMLLFGSNGALAGGVATEASRRIPDLEDRVKALVQRVAAAERTNELQQAALQSLQRERRTLDGLASTIDLDSLRSRLRDFQGGFDRRLGVAEETLRGLQATDSRLVSDQEKYRKSAEARGATLKVELEARAENGEKKLEAVSAVQQMIAKALETRAENGEKKLEAVSAAQQQLAKAQELLGARLTAEESQTKSLEAANTKVASDLSSSVESLRQQISVGLDELGSRLKESQASISARLDALPKSPGAPRVKPQSGRNSTKAPANSAARAPVLPTRSKR